MPRGVGCRGGARVPTHALFHGIRGRRGGVGGRRRFLLAISFVFHSRSDFFVISLVCVASLQGDACDEFEIYSQSSQVSHNPKNVHRFSPAARPSLLRSAAFLDNLAPLLFDARLRAYDFLSVVMVAEIYL